MKKLLTYKLFEATISDKSVDILLYKMIEHTDEYNVEELNAVTDLIKNSKNINFIYNYEGTALHMACFHKKEKIVRLLIEDDADVNILNDDNNTPILLANNNYNIIEMLINAGADVNVNKSHNRVSPLMSAVYHKHTDLVKLLIESGANVNMKNNDGETPLITAAIHNNKEIMNLLIKAGADMKATNKYDKNFIELQQFKVWLSEYESQYMILSKEPTLCNSIMKKVPLHPKIKKEFPHLALGTDMNLL